MNIRKHNADLVILQREAETPRFGHQPGWRRVDWKPTEAGGNFVYLRSMALPPVCSIARTDVKIEAPPDLYMPLEGGRLSFYRNMYITPGIRLLDRRTGRWIAMPRLHAPAPDGFAFVCLHPGPVEPDRNVLDFIRGFDLFLLNPGYRAAAGEEY